MIYEKLPEIEIYEDLKKEWRWKMTSNNGKIIAASTEGYESKQGCIKNMRLVGDQLSDRAISEAVKNQFGR